MSIEAMKQMIELYDKHSYNNDHGGIEFSKKHGYKFTEAVEALRTAIQQAEAQQPATGEPVWCVATGERVNGEETYTHHDAYVPLADCFPLYTHPAPGVQEGYVIVPIEPTDEMISAACQDGVSVDGRPVWKHSNAFQAKWKYQQMLTAAQAQKG